MLTELQHFQSWHGEWIAGWIIGNTVVGGVIAVLALLTDRCLQRPALAHLLWALVLVKLVTPPIVTIPIAIDPAELASVPGGWASTEAVADSRDARRLGQLTDALGGATTPAAQRANNSMLPYALAIWSFGSLALAVSINSSSRRLRRLLRCHAHPDSDATQLAAKLTAANATCAPPVWLVDAAVSPMLVGIGRRCRIVFPVKLWRRLDDRSRRLLLQHELEHWRRGDSWIRYLEMCCWVLCWWHPLVWVARRNIECCEERCCDLAACGGEAGARRPYAEAILTTLDFLSEPMEGGTAFDLRPVASTIGVVPQIEQRLRVIMSQQDGQRLGFASGCVFVAMTTLLPLHPAIVFHRQTAVEATVDLSVGERSYNI